MTKVVKYSNREVVLEKASIDSFRIYIPLVLIGRENINRAILSHTIEVDEDSGELLGKKRRKIKIEESGFEIHAHIREKNVQSGVEEQLVILLNAKFLESYRYFEGVTKDNFPIIFQKLIDKKVISDNVDYHNFLKISSVVDLDIKQDFRIPLDEWKLIRKATKEFKNYNRVDSNPTYNGGDGNLGFYFNTREKSTIARPFLKGYSKEVELKTNSKVFTDAFLKDLNLTDLRRIEVQVKDKKHFQSFGVNDNSLETILNLSHKELHQIQCKIFGKYKPISFKQEKAKAKNSVSLNVNQKFIYEIITNKMAEEKISFNKASEWALNFTSFGTRKAKSTFKKTLGKLQLHYEQNGFTILGTNYSFATKTRIFKYYNLI